jgi:hypothetical protein
MDAGERTHESMRRRQEEQSGSLDETALASIRVAKAKARVRRWAGIMTRQRNPRKLIDGTKHSETGDLISSGRRYRRRGNCQENADAKVLTMRLSKDADAKALIDE